MTDFALTRDTIFRERYALQFQWEMFNRANTTHFGYPGYDASSGSGGAMWVDVRSALINR